MQNRFKQKSEEPKTVLTLSKKHSKKLYSAVDSNTIMNSMRSAVVPATNAATYVLNTAK